VKGSVALRSRIQNSSRSGRSGKRPRRLAHQRANLRDARATRGAGLARYVDAYRHAVQELPPKGGELHAKPEGVIGSEQPLGFPFGEEIASIEITRPDPHFRRRRQPKVDGVTLDRPLIR
jgi:hypothetical protein